MALECCIESYTRSHQLYAVPLPFIVCGPSKKGGGVQLPYVGTYASAVAMVRAWFVHTVKDPGRMLRHGPGHGRCVRGIQSRQKIMHDNAALMLLSWQQWKSNDLMSMNFQTVTSGEVN